jgi:hypothetical protein
MTTSALDRYVIGREHNVVRVDFTRNAEPPTPPFPGAGAMRPCALPSAPTDFFSTSIKAEIAR